MFIITCKATGTQLHIIISVLKIINKAKVHNSPLYISDNYAPGRDLKTRFPEKERAA